MKRAAFWAYECGVCLFFSLGRGYHVGLWTFPSSAAKKKGASVEVAAVGAAAAGAIAAVAISAVGAASGAVETLGNVLI